MVSSATVSGGHAVNRPIQGQRRPARSPIAQPPAAQKQYNTQPHLPQLPGMPIIGSMGLPSVQTALGRVTIAPIVSPNVSAQPALSGAACSPVPIPGCCVSRQGLCSAPEHGYQALSTAKRFVHCQLSRIQVQRGRQARFAR